MDQQGYGQILTPPERSDPPSSPAADPSNFKDQSESLLPPTVTPASASLVGIPLELKNKIFSYLVQDVTFTGTNLCKWNFDAHPDLQKYFAPPHSFEPVEEITGWGYNFSIRFPAAPYKHIFLISRQVCDEYSIFIFKPFQATIRVHRPLQPKHSARLLWLIVVASQHGPSRNGILCLLPRARHVTILDGEKKSAVGSRHYQPTDDAQFNVNVLVKEVLKPLLPNIRSLRIAMDRYADCRLEWYRDKGVPEGQMCAILPRLPRVDPCLRFPRRQINQGFRVEQINFESQGLLRPRGHVCLHTAVYVYSKSARDGERLQWSREEMEETMPLRNWKTDLWYAKPAREWKLLPMKAWF